MIIKIIFIALVLIVTFSTKTVTASTTKHTVITNYNTFNISEFNNETMASRNYPDLLSIAMADPSTTALSLLFATEGALDSLSSNTLPLYNFHGPGGHGSYWELDPVMGKFPSIFQYDFEMPAIGGLILGIGLHLPKEIRIPLLVTGDILEGANVIYMLTTFGITTFAFGEFVAGIAVGILVTWAVYEVTSVILDYLFPKPVDPGQYLLHVYEKISKMGQFNVIF